MKFAGGLTDRDCGLASAVPGQRGQMLDLTGAGAAQRPSKFFTDSRTQKVACRPQHHRRKLPHRMGVEGLGELAGAAVGLEADPTVAGR